MSENDPLVEVFSANGHESASFKNGLCPGAAAVLLPADAIGIGPEILGMSGRIGWREFFLEGECMDRRSVAIEMVEACKPLLGGRDYTRFDPPQDLIGFD